MTSSPPSSSSDDVAIIGMVGRVGPTCSNIDQFWSALVNGLPTTTGSNQLNSKNRQITHEQLKQFGYMPIRGSIPSSDMASFDHELFRMSNMEAQTTDPQHRLLMQAVHEALEQAGINPDLEQSKQDHQGIGCFVTGLKSSYLQRLHERIENCVIPDLSDPNWSPQPQAHYSMEIGNSSDVLGTKIAYKLNLRGPSYTTLGSCCGGGVVLHTALRSILGDECETAVVGASVMRTGGGLLSSGYFYEEGLIMSKSGSCTPLSSQRDGTILSDGVSAIVIKRLSAAERDGNPILAVVRSSAVTNDGGGGIHTDIKSSIFSPSIDGQQRCIETALRRAGVHPQDIDFVEGHATGTRLGDPIELQALTNAFHKRMKAAASGESALTPQEFKNYCALGALKGIVGHTEGNAGLLSIIKCVLMYQYDIIPPHVKSTSTTTITPVSHKDDISPLLANSPFYLNHEPKPFVKNSAASSSSSPTATSSTTRLSGVNVYGLGGVNAHIILQENKSTAHVSPATSIAPSTSTHPHLLFISGFSPAALLRYLHVWAKFVRELSIDSSSSLSGELTIPASSTSASASAPFGVAWSLKHGVFNIANLCYTSVVGRKHYKYRIGLVLQNEQDLVQVIQQQLEAALEHEEEEGPNEAVNKSITPANPIRVVYAFPGQGSLEIASLRHLTQMSPLYARVIQEGLILAQKVFTILDEFDPYPRAADLINPFPGLVDIQAILSGGSDLATSQVFFYQQLLIFLHSYGLSSMWCTLLSSTHQPTLLYGHSVGEIGAACVGGLLTFTEAISLVCTRLWCMNRIPVGEMVVCRASLITLQQHIRSNLPVEVVKATNIAACNSEDQTVVSGGLEAMKVVRAELTKQGIQHKVMGSKQAFHSCMLEPILEQFQIDYKMIQNRAIELTHSLPTLPSHPTHPAVVYSTLTCEVLTRERAQTVQHWADQFRHRVSFLPTTQAIAGYFQRAHQYWFALELGHGNTCINLINKIVNGIKPVKVDDKQEKRRTSSHSNSIVQADDPTQATTSLSRTNSRSMSRADTSCIEQENYLDIVPIHFLVGTAASTLTTFATPVHSFMDAIAAVWTREIELDLDALYSGDIFAYLHTKPSPPTTTNSSTDITPRLTKIPCVPTYPFAATKHWLPDPPLIQQHHRTTNLTTSDSSPNDQIPTDSNLALSSPSAAGSVASNSASNPPRSSSLLDLVRGCMATILIQPPASLNGNSDFFLLGGDSFNSISFASQLNRKLISSYPDIIKTPIVQPTTFVKHSKLSQIVKFIHQQVPEVFSIPVQTMATRTTSKSTATVTSNAAFPSLTPSSSNTVTATVNGISTSRTQSRASASVIPIPSPTVEIDPLLAIFPDFSTEVLVLHSPPTPVASSSTSVPPRRWFCAPPVGGLGMDLRQLATALGETTQSEVCVFQHPTPAIDSFDVTTPEQHYTVTQLASVYKRQLLQTQSKGPYYLCGVSFGGIVAYELSQQLIYEGHSIELLVQLDSPLPAGSQVRPFMDSRATMLYFLATMKNEIQPSILMPFESLKVLNFTTPEELFKLAQLFQLAPQSTPNSTHLTTPGWIPLMNYLSILHGDMYALLHYQPKILPKSVGDQKETDTNPSTLISSSTSTVRDPSNWSSIGFLHSSLYVRAGEPGPIDPKNGDELWSPYLTASVTKQSQPIRITLPTSHSQLHRGKWAEEVARACQPLMK